MKPRKLWIALAALAILSPLGLIAVGSAWGEWGPESIAEMVGYVPEGMSKAARAAPEAPLRDYEFPGLTGSAWRRGGGTILAAFIGAGLTAAVSYALARMVRR